MKQKGYDTSLQETLDNYRILEETLQNKSDLKVLRPSQIDEKLHDIMRTLGNKKLDVSNLIKELDTDDIKKKQENYQFVE